MIVKKSYRKIIFKKISQRLNKSKFFGKIKITKEVKLFFFFWFLFFIILARLFYLQVVMASYYENILSSQHFSESLLKANRWHVFVLDKAGKALKLTENIDFFNVFVDPKYVNDKAKFIEVLSPIIYKHYCEINTTSKPSKIQCIKNIEKFSQTKILPEEPEIFYKGSGNIDGTINMQLTGWWLSGINQYIYNRDPYYTQKSQISSGYMVQFNSAVNLFTTAKALELIKKKMDEMIVIWYRQKNYLGFFENTVFLDELKALNLPYISIESKYYVYIEPSKVSHIWNATKAIQKILQKYWYELGFKDISNVFYAQENRYVRLISEANPNIIKLVNDLKLQYFNKIKDWIPLLHGLGTEKIAKRYYPYGEFLSNVLWYVWKNGIAQYGIEEYFDKALKGKDWYIVGRSTPWIGEAWSNDFTVVDVQHWDNVYLTIDPAVQKEVEKIIKAWNEEFRSDSVSALVLDPYNGKIISSANYPTFDPNNYNDIYDLQPLAPEDARLLTDLTFTDIPVFYLTGWSVKVATLTDRTNTNLRKYTSKNVVWPQAFIDKNIAFPYEPGSIFKAITIGVWVDSDEISLYDFYKDEGKVTIWPYTISNVDENCLWENNFLHAFIFSCNIGMVRIAQKIRKENFYNYVEKLWFWKMTNVELAWEDGWFVEDSNTVSVARFFNNSFWQWLLATPLQMAVAYAALVNGWYYVKPTIIEKVYKRDTNQFIVNQTKKEFQIFKPTTSDYLKEALFRTVNNPVIKKFSYIVGYTIGWKSWTSQISFKGKYQKWLWRTNGSFVWIVTKDNLKYVVVVQVRRPRSNLWWDATAGKVFNQIAKFLINYELIER